LKRCLLPTAPITSWPGTRGYRWRCDSNGSASDWSSFAAVLGYSQSKLQFSLTLRI
jgi:hypothetical protein